MLISVSISEASCGRLSSHLFTSDGVMKNLL